MKQSKAEIVREYGPFAQADRVNGVTYDGHNVWFASGEKLHAFDPTSGEAVRSLDVASHAGTAFDGKYIYQLAEDRIQKIDPQSGRVRSTFARSEDSGHSTYPPGTTAISLFSGGRRQCRQPKVNRPTFGEEGSSCGFGTEWTRSTAGAEATALR